MTREEILDARKNAELVILKRIIEETDSLTPLGVLQLAEARAWVVAPNSGHAGGSATPKT